MEERDISLPRLDDTTSSNGVVKKTRITVCFQDVEKAVGWYGCATPSQTIEDAIKTVFQLPSDARLFLMDEDDDVVAIASTLPYGAKFKLGVRPKETTTFNSTVSSASSSSPLSSNSPSNALISLGQSMVVSSESSPINPSSKNLTQSMEAISPLEGSTPEQACSSASNSSVSSPQQQPPSTSPSISASPSPLIFNKDKLEEIESEIILTKPSPSSDHILIEKTFPINAVDDDDDEERKKRKRRKAVEIDRSYKCSMANCQKVYGSENALKMHIKLKHPEFSVIMMQQTPLPQKQHHVVVGTNKLNNNHFHLQQQQPPQHPHNINHHHSVSHIVNQSSSNSNNNNQSNSSSSNNNSNNNNNLFSQKISTSLLMPQNQSTPSSSSTNNTNGINPNFLSLLQNHGNLHRESQREHQQPPPQQQSHHPQQSQQNHHNNDPNRLLSSILSHPDLNHDLFRSQMKLLAPDKLKQFTNMINPKIGTNDIFSSLAAASSSINNRSTVLPKGIMESVINKHLQSTKSNNINNSNHHNNNNNSPTILPQINKRRFDDLEDVEEELISMQQNNKHITTKPMIPSIKHLNNTEKGNLSFLVDKNKEEVATLLLELQQN